MRQTTRIQNTGRFTGTGESISGVSLWTGAREATWRVAADSYIIATSVVRCTLVYICRHV